MKPQRIAEEQGATFVVNLPELNFDIHVKRIVTVLRQHGYRAMPMSGQYVLEMAEQVRKELQAAEESAALTRQALANARPTEET